MLKRYREIDLYGQSYKLSLNMKVAREFKKLRDKSFIKTLGSLIPEDFNSLEGMEIVRKILMNIDEEDIIAIVFCSMKIHHTDLSIDSVAELLDEHTIPEIFKVLFPFFKEAYSGSDNPLEKSQALEQVENSLRTLTG